MPFVGKHSLSFNGLSRVRQLQEDWEEKAGASPKMTDSKALPCALLSAFLFFCFSFSVFSTPPRSTENLHKLFICILYPST